MSEASMSEIQADAPRPETWFRRRVGPVAAVRELWGFRELIVTLAERDLRVRYKQAVLGLAWAVLTPLMLMAAFSLVFTRFTHVDAQGVPYALFSFIGLVPWTFFSTGLTRGGASLVSNLPLLNKVYCPREVFPLASIALAAADALAATVVLGLLFVIIGYAPHIEVLYAPVLMLVAFEFTLGVTLLVSVFFVYFREVQVMLPLIAHFGLFLTPVAYGVDAVVDNQRQLIVYSVLNPLAPVIDGIRRGALFGESQDWLALRAGAGRPPLLLPA